MEAVRVKRELERGPESNDGYGFKGIKHAGIYLNIKALGPPRKVPGYLVVAPIRSARQAKLRKYTASL